MNSWSFSGHCAADAETRFTPAGDAIVSFSVGVKSGYGEKASTTWARCSMFGKRGQAVADYLLKGQLVGVVGELSAREWEDKQGQKRTSIEVRVNELTLLGKKQGGASQPEAPRPQQAPQPSAPPRQAAPPAGGGFADMSDDIPFDRLARGMASYIV